jgi:hypothetical protein
VIPALYIYGDFSLHFFLFQLVSVLVMYLMLSDWVSFLVYLNLFGIKGFIVVVVVVVVS